MGMPRLAYDKCFYSFVIGLLSLSKIQTCESARRPAKWMYLEKAYNYGN